MVGGEQQTAKLLKTMNQPSERKATAVARTEGPQKMVLRKKTKTIVRRTAHREKRTKTLVCNSRAKTMLRFLGGWETEEPSNSSISKPGFTSR